MWVFVAEDLTRLMETPCTFISISIEIEMFSFCCTFKPKLLQSLYARAHLLGVYFIMSRNDQAGRIHKPETTLLRKELRAEAGLLMLRGHL